MKRISCLLVFIPNAVFAAQGYDLSGKWEIHSSVGGTIPITVRCELIQEGTNLTGTCIPEMENPEASQLTGTVSGDSAQWSYHVVFNANPGTVEFQAETITENGILGTLNLSGTPAPFAALKR